MILSGRIVEVSTVPIGDALVGDHAAGATVLTMNSTVDFEQVGEVSITDDADVTYLLGLVEVDEEASTITVAAPGLPIAFEADTFVAASPVGEEREALVMVEDGDEPVGALVPQTALDRVPEGVREPGTEEACEIDDRSGRWTLSDVMGMPLVLDGSFIDPATIPPAQSDPELDLRLDALEADLSNLNTVTLPALDADLATLRDTTIPTLDADLATLRDTTLPALDADLATLRDTTIPALDTDLATLRDTTLPALDARVVTAQNEVNAVEGKFPITGPDIAANAVTAAKIEALAVVAGKIAANAVTATTIAANAVTANAIAADAVTANSIAASAVTATEIAANAVIAGKIAANAVTATTIATDAVIAGKIAANAVTATEIAANAVIAGKIAANAVTATTIAANAVTANAIAANAVTANSIAADAINGKTITGATVQTAVAGGNRITLMQASSRGELRFYGGGGAIDGGSIQSEPWVTSQSLEGEQMLITGPVGPLTTTPRPRIRLRTRNVGAATEDGVYIDNAPLYAEAGATIGGSGKAITKGVQFGVHPGNCNTSGQTTTSHGLGVAPTSIILQPTSAGPAGRTCTLVSSTTTTFTVNHRSNAAALLNGHAIEFHWVAIA